MPPWYVKIVTVATLLVAVQSRTQLVILFLLEMTMGTVIKLVT